MFDRILDFILSIFNEIFPVFVVAEYQEAVVLRGGKFNRVCKKGIHLKIPYLDEVFKQHTVLTTLTIPAQSLTTQDGFNVVVKSMVKYKISDIKVFALEVYDSVDAISDVTMSIVKHIVMKSNWKDCVDLEIDNTISKKLRNEMKKFGVYVESVTLTDIAQIRTLRLINENVLNA